MRSSYTYQPQMEVAATLSVRGNGNRPLRAKTEAMCVSENCPFAAVERGEIGPWQLLIYSTCPYSPLGVLRAAVHLWSTCHHILPFGILAGTVSTGWEQGFT